MYLTEAHEWSSMERSMADTTAEEVVLIALVLLTMVGFGRSSECMMFAPPPKVAANEALTERLRSVTFTSAFAKLWSPHHQRISHDHLRISLSLDNASSPSGLSSSNPRATGFKSKVTYLRGFFNVGMKLSSKPHTAGVVTSFYLSNAEAYPNERDEIKLEFLGRASGEEYVLQTNVVSNGSTSTGREQRLRLWFDPTADFHNYSIMWTSNRTALSRNHNYNNVAVLYRLFIDDIPVREFPSGDRHSAWGYLTKPMSIYAAIWDGSEWATNGGKDPIDYGYAPYGADYSNFILTGCRALADDATLHCDPNFALVPTKLTHHQHKSLAWVQHNLMTYNYCDDSRRYLNRLPDCPRTTSVKEESLRTHNSYVTDARSS